MTSIFKFIIFLMTFIDAWASNVRKIFMDQHYIKSREENDKISYPNRRRTQLYSRNSGRHVQVLFGGKVVAKGASGDKFAGLVILTSSYGRVRIKGLVADRFLCFDKRGHLISKKRATARCIFRETFGKDAFTEYESANIKGKFLAFSKKGNPRFKAKSKSGTKAVQFVERPKPIKIPQKNRYYRGKQRGILLKYRKMLARQSKINPLRLSSSQENYGLSFRNMMRNRESQGKFKKISRKLKKRRRNGKRKNKGKRNSRVGEKRNSTKNRG